MASGTVGYTDTRGSKDYTSIIANQIGKRLKEASDMASEERAYAAGKAEAGGTSLEEAGIGKGYFFGRALGNRFGGDRISRTKGRMGATGAANNPAASYKQRFRGGFDYNVTNQVSNITDTVPLSNAVVTGLRGVQGGLVQVASAISRQDSTMDGLANTQADMAKAIMFNGYLFQMFMSQQRAKSGRSSARREERSIEGRRGGGGGIGGASFGGAGGRRGMINVTGGSSGSGGLNQIKKTNRGQSVAGALGSYAQSQFVKGSQTAIGTGKAIAQFAPSFSLDQTAVAGKSSQDLAQILAGKTEFIGEQVGKRVGASPNVVKAITGYITEKLPFMKSTKLVDDILGNKNTLDFAKSVLGKNASPESILMMSKTLSPGGSGKNVSVLHDASTLFAKGSGILKRKDLGASHLVDEMIKIQSGMGVADFLMMKDRFGTKEARRLMNLGFIESDSRIVQQISKKFKGVPFKDPMQAVAVTEIANRVDKGMDVVDAVDDVVKIYGPGIKNAIAGASEMIPAKSNLAKALAKATGKTASKGVLRSVLKQIPIIAGVAGVVFGIQRLLEGDLLGAGLEITSGLLGATGTTPGLGLAIDGFLLGRDLGVMPMRTGGKMSGFPLNSLLSVNGKALASFNEPGNPESIVVERDNENRFVDMGKGIVDGFKERRGDYVALQASGVESGINTLGQSGFFSGLFDTTKDVVNNVKKPFGGIMNWFNRGAKPNEGAMSWKDLFTDDWAQRQRTAGPGKGGWNPFRGMPGYGSIKNFLTGTPGNEIAGGFQTGPTPLIRQSILRGAGLLMNPKAAILAALMKPTALGDGTLTGNTEYLNSLGNNQSMQLQNLPLSGNGLAATVINNNYYQNSSSGGTESGDETLGQSFNMDLEKFITNYSIMSK